MCGIVGIWQDHGIVDAAAVRRSTDALAHRGPDDEGYSFVHRKSAHRAHFAGPSSPGAIMAVVPDVADAPGWAYENGPDLALGHRRFAIIAPTPDGHQPFWDNRGEVVVCFNGEIYNYLELRDELRRLGHTFRTASDTEVLVEAYRAWGTDCFRRLNGMWAVAFYDTRSRELILSRDRAGERPLYWSRTPGRIAFASEIRALTALTDSDGRPEVDDSAAYGFLCAPTPDWPSERTFFKGIEMIPAASVVRIRGSDQVEQWRFWGVPDDPRPEGMTSAQIRDACGELRDLLQDSVKLRLRADVPVNVALSGGMDSSSVVAFASRLRGDGVDTYTVRFPQPEWNEWPYAAAVAERWNVNNMVVDPPDSWMWGQLGSFVPLMEEPFHAPDLVTDHTIRRILGSRGIRVNLSGIGGDELFAGYQLYRWLRAKDFKREGNYAAWLRELWMASDGIPRQAAAGLARRVLGRFHGKSTGDPRASIMAAAISRYPEQSFLVLPETLPGRLQADFDTLLIPYWMRVGDKSSMGVPIEVRYPFLDHRLIEFAARLPFSVLLRDGWLKWILRKATEDLLPRQVVWRRQKMGFPFPMGEWLRASRAELSTVFGEMENPYLENAYWTSHLDEAIETDGYLVWRALSFELWHRHFIRGLPVMPDSLQNAVFSPRFEVAAA